MLGENQEQAMRRKYEENFSWIEEDIDEERNTLMKDYKVDVVQIGEQNDLEEGLNDNTPPSTRNSMNRMLPKLTDDDRTKSPRQPPAHLQNKGFEENFLSFCCCARSKDLNKRENRFYNKFKT